MKPLHDPSPPWAEAIEGLYTRRPALSLRRHEGPTTTKMAITLKRHHWISPVPLLSHAP